MARVGARRRSISARRTSCRPASSRPRRSIQAAATSKGCSATTGFTAADYNLTARTPDGTGSGWASKSFNELRLLDPRSSPRRRSTRRRWRRTRRDRAGQLHGRPRAGGVADLLAFMMFSADARQADEGRSFFSKKGGGNRIGEQVLGEKVRIYSDPAHPLAPSSVRRRGAADQAQRLGRQGRAEGPVLLAVLGAEAEARRRPAGRRT